MLSSTDFHIWAHTCRPPPGQGRYIISRFPQESPPTASFIPRGNCHPDFYHHRCIVPAFELYINEVLEEILCYAWVFSHSIESMGFIQLRLEQCVLFHGMKSSIVWIPFSGFHCMNISWSPFHWDRPLDGFQFEAAMNHATIHICVQSQLMIGRTSVPLGDLILTK